MPRKSKYESDVELGKVYEDPQTGFQGTATVVSFFQHACERVVLEARVNADGKIISESFDAPRLVDVDTGSRAKSARPGGPGHGAAGDRPSHASR